MVKKRSMQRHSSWWASPILDTPPTGRKLRRETIRKGEDA